jgi:hypothetical protein
MQRAVFGTQDGGSDREIVKVRMLRTGRETDAERGPVCTRRYCTPRRRMPVSSSLMRSEESANGASTENSVF